ncbi:MAG: ABC transporter ATP-binding protein [Promethearchaeota archaeon]
MTNAIEISNLSKVFISKKREIWALDNLSFSVRKGEIFGLLGPNGAGKTTSIRLIAGILRPTTGNIYVNGENIQGIAHIVRKNMGFLTENHGSYENFSVYENLQFFGSFYNIKNLDSRISEILKKIGLFERKDMKAGKLSKGQKQRLAIARTILHDPEMLFFDEPTSGLDPKAAVKIRNLILSLKRKNRTIFINSHNLEEVQKICDRVAILDQGNIKKIGTPADLSSDLWDSQEIVLTLKGTPNNKIKELFSEIDYIKSYNIDGNKIRVFSEDVNETTPLIINSLVMMGVSILEVNRITHSLEDIYLKLMEDNSEGL